MGHEPMDTERLAAHPDLGLTNDEVVARYLRQIADGPDCAKKLREQGFEAWCDMWWQHHATAKERLALADPGGPPIEYEWDSRNYDNDAMREIYDAIIMHASRPMGISS